MKKKPAKTFYILAGEPNELDCWRPNCKICKRDKRNKWNKEEKSWESMAPDQYYVSRIKPYANQGYGDISFCADQFENITGIKLKAGQVAKVSLTIHTNRRKKK